MLGFTPVASATLASSGSTDVSVSVTGLAATGALGSVSVSTDVSISVNDVDRPDSYSFQSRDNVAAVRSNKTGG